MNFNLKRPKRLGDEGEDDLIEFQEKFLQNKTNEQPAAKCVRKTLGDESPAKPAKEIKNYDCEFLGKSKLKQ